MADRKSFTDMGYIAYVFMIVSTVISGLVLIPLAWHIPMLVYYKNNAGRVGTGFKVCALLFCGLIPGVLMLCDTKTNNLQVK
ncbi:MAG: hypothetical protein ACOQNY_02080 [Mycoplasmoidaceae bacterium]